MAPSSLDQPLVSVVIIFLNAKRFIGEAIESVFAQAYRTWELLLVDDGSTDESTAIARGYAQQHPERVRYLSHPGHVNRGTGASRNLGLREARGQYIGFLDADDVWSANTLEEQVALLEAHPDVAMLYGPILWWYSWTGRPEDQGRDYIESLGVPSDTVIHPPRLLPLFLRNKAAVPSGILVRREITERVGGFEDEFRGEYEDQVFCAKICLNARVFSSGECWYRYRQHPDSCVATGQQTGQTHAARLAFLSWLATYLAEQNVRDQGVWRALELEFWRFRHPRAFRMLRRAEHFVDQLKQSLRRSGRRT
jgi:glycosyltransferase involved in cell wall biosynthesis